MADDVRLRIGASDYGGWKSISVRRSLDTLADSFDLTLTDRWSADAARRPVRLGETCEVWIGEEKLITGYVDEVRPRYDAKQRSLTVSGRSKTADLVDCALPASVSAPAQKNRQTLPELASALAKPFAIKVVSEVTGLPKIDRTVTEPGQTAFEIIEVKARTAAVMLLSNPDGNLVITRASDEHINTPLILGENILEADGEFSQRERFSHYHFVGQQADWGNNIGAAGSAHVKGQAEDVAMRYRPTTVVAEGAGNTADMRRRAEWQRNVSYGRSRQANYSVNDWRHSDGLWAPNRLVQVFDEWMGFDGEWLMIGTAEFVHDERGQRTRLTVMPKEAYDLIPLPANDKDKPW
jgi:prophage tail gpP-like protein